MLAGPAAKRFWKRLRERRARSLSAARQTDSLLGTLSRLLDHAERYRIRIALVPGGLPCEAPDLGDIERCLAEFAGAPLSILGDTLRLDRYRRSDGPEAAEWIDRMKRRLAGVVVHDGDALREHRPLGEGEADIEPWRALAGEPGEAGAPRPWILDLEAGTVPDASAACRARLVSLLHPRAAGETGAAEGRARVRPSFLDTSLRDPL
jgi:sugar phosphate isomerase/epimerase